MLCEDEATTIVDFESDDEDPESDPESWCPQWSWRWGRFCMAHGKRFIDLMYSEPDLVCGDAGGAT